MQREREIFAAKSFIPSYRVSDRLFKGFEAVFVMLELTDRPI